MLDLLSRNSEVVPLAALAGSSCLESFLIIEFMAFGMTPRRNPFGVDALARHLSQGSGVPQPWAGGQIPFGEEDKSLRGKSPTLAHQLLSVVFDHKRTQQQPSASLFLPAALAHERRRVMPERQLVDRTRALFVYIH